MPSLFFFMGYVRKLDRYPPRRPGERSGPAGWSCAHEAGDQLSEDELIGMIALLLIAGHETTMNLIGNGMLALMEHPDSMEQLRSDPTLIKSAIEELLRYDGPLETATERFARENVTIHGITIPRGEMVFAVLASANRDERQFERPDELDLSQEPNRRHVAFPGLAYTTACDAPLARLEGQIAINTLLRRIPELRLSVTVKALRWRPGLVLHGMSSLPVTLTGRHASTLRTVSR